MPFEKRRTRRFVLYLAIISVILGVGMCLRVYSCYEGIGIARRLPKPRLFAEDLVLHWSPDKTHVVKVYATRQGALGTDYMWVCAWDNKGNPYLVVEGYCIVDANSPVSWLTNKIVCVALLTPDKSGGIERCFEIAQDGRFQELQISIPE